MTTTMTPTEQLDSAFDDIASTETEIKQREEAEREAQKQADDTRGLVGAANRALKNAEAAYRVLAAAAEETKGLRDKRERIEARLKEIGQAEAVRDATKAAVPPLDDAVNAVNTLAEATQQAMGDTNDAKTQVDTDIEGTTYEGGQEEPPASVPSKRGSQGKALAARKNWLGNISAALGTDYENLLQLYGNIAGYLAALQEQAGVVQTAAGDAADFANSLQPEKTKLGNELAKINAKLAKEPSPAEVSQAEADRNTAKDRSENAPLAERQAQEALRSAREAREDAQRRHRDALDRRDRAEDRFITDIEITGPNAAGTFRATAVLAEDLPPDYKLKWSSDAGTIGPNIGGTVEFHTGKLPPGTYDITVSLVRTLPAP